MSEQDASSRVISDFFVRKADLDDVEALNQLISEDNKADLNQLFDYPKLTTLLERYLRFKQDLTYLWWCSIAIIE